MPKIQSITAYKILDSRGDWTIETKVVLSDGSISYQSVPQGASTGEKEAVYVDVDRAVNVVSNDINNLLRGEDPLNQEEIDKKLIALDGTENKSNLGGNSIISVSLAVARVAAYSQKIELYEYLSDLYGKKKTRKDLIFPTPVFNILNGGKHAGNNLSFQEFMVLPNQGLPFDKKIEMGINVYKDLKEILKKEKGCSSVGDEGGFAPTNITVLEVLEYIKDAIEKRHKLGEEVFMGMDVASSSFYERSKKQYVIKEQDLFLDRGELLRFYIDLVKSYPIIYIEDPYGEDDYAGWEEMFKTFNNKLMVVGDDLVVTNPKYLESAIKRKLLNAVIVKPNQVGTLTETLKFIKIAKDNKLSVCVSHRSGDTAKDTFIADLALATESEFIKSGSPVRGERVAKYNRLLEVFFSK